jgi:5-methylcytosine-specific restriction endonuclease McrA
MTTWQDQLCNWRHDEPPDPDPEKQRQVAAWLLKEFRDLKRSWGLGEQESDEVTEHIDRPQPVQGPPKPPVGINYSYEILVEVEESLGMAWYEELTRTIAPWATYVENNPKWSDPPRLAYWISPNGLYLHDQAPHNLIKILIEKRVLWHEYIGKLTEIEAWQNCSTEFNNLDFGTGAKNCEQCDKEFKPFFSIMEFARTNPWHLSNDRKFCSQACRHEHEWQATVRKGMHPNAEFDKSVTRDAIWKRYGPRCYLCGLEVFYDQPDLRLRNKSKAWKARWGDVDKYDVNRQAVVEHVLPRSKGGSHTWDNVRIACSRCNLLKGDTQVFLETASDN